MPQLYKVLVDGRSCHSGDLSWSLPKDGQPGEWHEVDGPLIKCERGFHLTDDPARWWQDKCKVYVVDAEGVIGSCDDDTDRKVVARKVRLVREASIEELSVLRIWSEGTHTVKGNEVCIASGSATVAAYGSATVAAYGLATVTAYDSATVTASGSATVTASGSATVTAYGSATVTAYDSATVTAYDSATVRAYGSATVTASGSATVTAYGSATVTAYGLATVISFYGKPSVSVTEYAVWIDRGDKSKMPVVRTALSGTPPA